MFLIVAAILVILWFVGLIGHIGGGLINILIVIALISIIYHFLRGGKTTV